MASEKVLIDSSAWMHLFRREGNPQLKNEIGQLLLNGQAGWNELIRLELWHGAGSAQDLELLGALERDALYLSITDDVWRLSCQVANKSRSVGKPVPTTDQIIFACAQFYDVGLLHRDKHFDMLSRLWTV